MPEIVSKPKEKHIFIAKIFIAICLFIYLFTPPEAFPNEIPLSIRKTFLLSFALHNTTSVVQRGIIFRTRAPVSQTSYQKAVKLEASENFKLIKDLHGNQTIEIKIAKLPPYSTRIINIKATVDIYQCPALEIPSPASFFLKPAKFVESNRPEIVSFARNFKRGTPKRIAREIFDWISKNIRYSKYTAKEQGALYCMKHKKGDCTEFTDLFVALARCHNIPARRMAGYLCGNSPVLDPSRYHNWAEFYDENDRKWYIADPARQIFKCTRGTLYLATRIILSERKVTPDFERFYINNRKIKVQTNHH